jgi:hypothetical protein
MTGSDLSVAGVHMRTRGATQAYLGMIGSKRAQGGSMFQRSFGTQPTYPETIAFEVTTVAHTSESSKKAAEAQVAAGTTAGGSAGGESVTTREGTFRLITLTGNVVEALNSPNNFKALEELRRNGGLGRIITTIARTEDYSESCDRKFTINIFGKIYSAVTGKVSGTTSSVANRTLSAGTIFAYEISRVCWERNADGQFIIGALMPDQPGNDPPCPDGLIANPADPH